MFKKLAIVLALVSVCQSMQLLTADNVTELLDAIDIINEDNDDITLTISDGIYELDSEIIISEVMHNIKIRGSGETQLTNSLHRIFSFIDNSSISINLIEFSNNDLETELNGGAININSSYVNFTNVDFIHCRSQVNGGAVYAINSELNVNNANFQFCTSNFGGAVYAEHSRIIIGSNNNTCMIDHNRSFLSGGAIFLYKCNFDISNVEFSANIANDNMNTPTDGGAIEIEVDGYNGFVPDIMQIENCQFIGNHSTDYGGAISACGMIPQDNIPNLITFSIATCIFKTNGSGRGGSLSVDRCEVSGSTFGEINDTASHSSANDGGEIYAGGNTVINNCQFYYPLAGGFGGAIYCGNNSETSSVGVSDCTFIGAPEDASQFRANAGQGGAIFVKQNSVNITNTMFYRLSAALGGAIGTSIDKGLKEVNVDNSIFQNCCANNGVGESHGGAIDCGGRLYCSNSIYKNCFAIVGQNPGWGRGGAIHISDDMGDEIDIQGGLELLNCAFVGCSVVETNANYGGLGNAIYARFVRLDSDIDITTCTIKDCNRNDTYAENSIFFSNAGGPTNIIGSIFDENYYSIIVPNNTAIKYCVIHLETIPGNIVSEIGLPENHDATSDPVLLEDGQRKWSSPCYDILASHIEFDGEVYDFDVDFDQTAPDIGWTPILPEIELTSIPGDGHLPAANYKLISGGIICAPNLNIEPGTAIRVEGSFPLNIYSTSGNFTIGDIDGPRTSITTMLDVAHQATSVVFGNDANPLTTSLNGWLLKDVPESGVTFAGLEGLRFSPDISQPDYEPNVQIMKSISAPLRFVKCTGEIVGVPIQNTSDNASWSSLSIGGGGMTVSNCNFRNNAGTNSAIPLTFASSSQSTVKNCFFDANNDAPNRFSILQSGGTLKLRNNAYNNIRYRTIHNNMGQTLMGYDARNSFVYNPQHTDNACIYSNYGRLDLKCGYNAFLYNGNAIPSAFRFVDTYKCFEQWDWSRNFWGTNLNSPLTCAEAATHVPCWAIVNNCLATWSPNDPFWCPGGNNPDVELWTFGQTAEDERQVRDAIYFYSELVRLFPASKFAPLAADRLKVLGQKNADYYVDAKLGLGYASLAAETEDVAWLKGMAQASGLLLDAQYMDREGAFAALDSLSLSADSLVAAHAQFARLEAETLPLASLSSFNPAAAWSACERRLGAWDRLFNLGSFQPGVQKSTTTADAALATPEKFQLSRIYPNPFNPYATLEIVNPKQQVVVLKVYNMAGGLVSTLHSDILEMGIHSFIFNGTRLASGMYIATASCGTSESSQKLLLLK